MLSASEGKFEKNLKRDRSEALVKTMKWINRAIALAALLALSTVAAWAQTQECTDEFKTAKYTEWYNNRQSDQDVAYKAANDFLTACPNEPADGPWAPQLKALKKFKGDYEDLVIKKKLATDFDAAVKNKNYVDQIRVGKQLVAIPSNADNAVIYIIMAGAGLGDPNVMSDSAAAAKKAIDLIEGGKPFAPTYQTKDQALAAMNYVLAKAALKNSPNDAIAYFVKAAKYESDLKKSALLYNELAGAYGEGPVAKLTEDYKKYIGQPESDASKLVLANLNQALDRQIDAYARAAALSTNAADKKAVMETLTELYEFRNKTKEGVDQLVAGILSKPLPEPPTPITTLPTATTTPSPAGSGSPTGGGASSTGAAPTTTNAKPAGSSPGSGNGSMTGTQTSAPAKPTSTPTPKPKPRRANHRRG